MEKSMSPSAAWNDLPVVDLRLGASACCVRTPSSSRDISLPNWSSFVHGLFRCLAKPRGRSVNNGVRRSVLLDRRHYARLPDSTVLSLRGAQS